jgi:hypothetical protein
MEMDVYKVSLVSIGLAIFIVAGGVFMGVKGQGQSKDEIYLTAPVRTQNEEQTNQEPEPIVFASPVQETPEEDLKMDLSFKPSKNVFPPMLLNPKMTGSVFLTFVDDNLSPDALSKLLIDLKFLELRATFFVTGRSLEQQPDIWRKVLKDGHEICNYTYSGKSIEGMSGMELAQEIRMWEIAASKVLSAEYVALMKEHFPFMKFPEDKIVLREALLRAVENLGYRPVGYRVSSKKIF